MWLCCPLVVTGEPGGLCAGPILSVPPFSLGKTHSAQVARGVSATLSRPHKGQALMALAQWPGALGPPFSCGPQAMFPGDVPMVRHLWLGFLYYLPPISTNPFLSPNSSL